MKVGIKSYDKTTVVTVPDGIDVDELGNILFNLCLSQGWSKETLKRIFIKDVING